MKNIIILLSIFTLIFSISAFAVQNPYTVTADSIFKHISVLANDSLEGRRVGDPGELAASKYIRSIFESAGLHPKGDNGSFIQEFQFNREIKPGDKNRLVVNGVELQLKEEFQPLFQSGNMVFEFDEVEFVDFGFKIPKDDGGYNDYENKDVNGKAVIIKRFAPSSEDNPHVDFDKYSSLTDKIQTAIDQKAAGVFFITPDKFDDTLFTEMSANITPKNIPIVLLRRTALERIGLDLEKPEISTIAGETEMIKIKDTAYNVVGYVPTGNDTTFIIGAHYDHLGWGGHSSLYREKEPMIHNGADDNGSGTSAMLEMARYYSTHRDELKYSILFIAFTGEEYGLLGAGHFAKNMTIDSSKVRMMINLDMIGRLKDQDDGLAVLGTGTCDEFKTYFDSLKQTELTLALKESGSGPSDQTVFYNRKIPSLHLFTGAHKDYHKPSDDVEKIDAPGILKVINFASEMIEYFDNYSGPLTFRKTKDSGEGKKRTRFSVTLGIMPDYVAEVRGVKVDGVTPEKPGEKAGILEGDIIIKLGDKILGDIYDYMSCLGKFRKGDSTTVVVERGTDTLTLPLNFD